MYVIPISFLTRGPDGLFPSVFFPYGSDRSNAEFILSVQGGRGALSYPRDLNHHSLGQYESVEVHLDFPKIPNNRRKDVRALLPALPDSIACKFSKEETPSAGWVPLLELGELCECLENTSKHILNMATLKVEVGQMPAALLAMAVEEIVLQDRPEDFKNLKFWEPLTKHLNEETFSAVSPADIADAILKRAAATWLAITQNITLDMVEDGLVAKRMARANEIFDSADFGEYNVLETGGWEIVRQSWSRVLYVENEASPLNPSTKGSFSLLFERDTAEVAKCIALDYNGNVILEFDNRVQNRPASTAERPR